MKKRLIRNPPESRPPAEVLDECAKFLDEINDGGDREWKRTAMRKLARDARAASASLVLAANAHDGLVEALEAVVDLAHWRAEELGREASQVNAEDGPTADRRVLSARKAVIAARTALAAARGQGVKRG